MDAKYYRDALRTSHGGAEKLHSGNLFQIYSYVKAKARASADRVDGMLVYPTTSRELDLDYLIDGHSFKIRTVNLATRWSDIEKRLLLLTEPTAL